MPKPQTTFPRLKSHPWGLNPIPELQIPSICEVLHFSLKPKSQSPGRNPSLQAHILAKKAKTQPQGPNSSLKALIQPKGPNHNCVKEKKKIPHLCESIGYRPFWSLYPAPFLNFKHNPLRQGMGTANHLTLLRLFTPSLRTVEWRKIRQNESRIS